MLKILSAKATETSKSFKALPRRKGEDNLAWMTRAKLSATGVYLLLVGGRDAIAFRLRMAQSHVRHDFTPSHWSHVMLLGQVTRRLADTMVYEISLDPPWIRIPPAFKCDAGGATRTVPKRRRVSEHRTDSSADLR
jgi:hypothetical protein